MKLCECGCKQAVRLETHRFLSGHQNRGKNNPMYGSHPKLSDWHKKRISESQKGSGNSMWKGGKKKSAGRWFIYLPNHPYCDKKGCVRQSRLVLEKYLGRYLKSNEIAHHINKIIDDDRIENLKLMDKKEHLSHHHKGKFVSEETKKKLSKAKKGKRIGHIVAKETRIKISKANKGKKRTEELKKKMSKARKGKTANSKTKKKMSASGLKAWEKRKEKCL